MSPPLSAIQYTDGLKFEDIFRRVGESVNVFISVSSINPNSPSFSSRSVFGPRPYHIKSDILAIVAHMGIIIPTERGKKLSSESFSTNLQAMNFGYSSRNSLQIKKIEENFRLDGVIVTFFTTDPLPSYPSAQGALFDSERCSSPGPFSIDVFDFSFVTEFQIMPDIVTDIRSIVKAVSPRKSETTDSSISVPFDSFTLTMEEISELLADFYLIFHFCSDDMKIIKLSSGICITKAANPNGAIFSGLSLDDVNISSGKLVIKGAEFGEILGVTFQKRETYDIAM